MHNVIRLKKLNVQPDDMTGVLELDAEEGLDNKKESDKAVKTFEYVKLGGKITWSDPVMTEPTCSTIIRLGWVISLPDRLTYTPAV